MFVIDAARKSDIGAMRAEIATLMLSLAYVTRRLMRLSRRCLILLRYAKSAIVDDAAERRALRLELCRY